VSLICLIPARAGSKGIPNKNLRTVAGISLVGWAVYAAREFIRLTGLTEAMIVVDTDGDAIAEEARRWGAAVPFLRPAELAGDAVPTADNSIAALDRLERNGIRLETVVLLQPTSPLRSAEDILACWRAYETRQRPSVISVAETEHPAGLALRIGATGTAEWLGEDAGAKRRQELAPTFWPSGAVYVISTALLRRERTFIVPGVTRPVELPRARSVDVDTEEDLTVAENWLSARPTLPVLVGGRTIGPGNACLIIAEAGVNHNGDGELAHRLIDVAAEAGADAVKFQTFEPEQLVSARSPKAAYQIAGTGAAESQLDMLRRLTLPRELLIELAAHAASRGLLFLSTPFDSGSADLLDQLGMPAFKIPSGEVTNHPLVAHVSGRGKPVLMSTGMSTMAEIADAVAVVRANGNPPLALLHCVTDYPATPGDCNLRAIETMRRAFGVPVGWSDHTAGLSVALAAVAAGASVVEKHFTLDRRLPGPDHRASLEPSELAALVTAIRETEAAMGDGHKRPVPAEAANAAVVRRSLHAARRLQSGHVIEDKDLVALRPGTGIPPSERDRLVGRALRVEVPRGEMLQEHHLA
jgi:N-acetylneuraminate synthase/N,N'-diacetyllegionaminate synthase